MTRGCAVTSAGKSATINNARSMWPHFIPTKFVSRRGSSPRQISSPRQYNPRMRYLHYDVFTDTMFEGNQLAVFHDARGLSTEQMQAITKEMNFSECTFILPPEKAGTDVRMRIFTPGTELPMAGHPTIGSTFALAELGVITAGADSFVFGLGVGPTKVELTWE